MVAHACRPELTLLPAYDVCDHQNKQSAIFGVGRSSRRKDASRWSRWSSVPTDIGPISTRDGR